jgi:predicted nuclease of predicted toxin-antitoxin system
MNMLFKVDENLPIEIAELLSDLGHDAKTIKNQNLQGVNGRVLLERCDKEKRILVTLDIDFSDIRTYPPQDHEGIILLRVGNQSKTCYWGLQAISTAYRPRANQKMFVDCGGKCRSNSRRG